jgi:hypothetical protein
MRKKRLSDIRYESHPNSFGHSYRVCRNILCHDFLL